MIQLMAKQHSLVSNSEQLRNWLTSLGPAHWASRRADALEAFALAGLPTVKDEEFRYMPIRFVEETAYAPAYGVNIERSELDSTLVSKVVAHTYTFVNGQVAPEVADEAVLPEGVFVGSLQDAYEVLPEVVERWLGAVASLKGRLGSTNDERFVYLNTAYLGEGVVVYVPKGVVVELPVHLAFVSKGEGKPFAAFPRVLVVLEENAQMKLVESYVGLSGEAFNVPVTEVVLANHAILEHDRIQEESSNTVHIGNLAVHQESSSTYTSNVVHFGGRVARLDLNVWLNGEHTETWLNAVYLATGEQIVDNHTRIDHAFPNCNSFEVYKGVLRDKSVGVFNGKIFVYQDAQKTDAKQTNQALLLSPTATINTKPQLEIFADDVKCTHGATIGQLREDALFYLRARGIPKEKAQALLVYAFAAEVIDRITITDLRETLERKLYALLAEA